MELKVRSSCLSSGIGETTQTVTQKRPPHREKATILGRNLSYHYLVNNYKVCKTIKINKRSGMEWNQLRAIYW